MLKISSCYTLENKERLNNLYRPLKSKITYLELMYPNANIYGYVYPWRLMYQNPNA